MVQISNRGVEKYKSETRLKLALFLSFLLFIMILTGISIIQYRDNYNSILVEIDKRLFLGAKSVELILSKDFHDRAIQKNAISTSEDDRNIDDLSSFSKKTGYKFLYTLVKKGDAIFITTSNATEEELAKNEQVRYYTLFDEADNNFKKAFENEQRVSFTHEDRWGIFRAAAVLEKSPKGNKYLSVAELDIAYVREILNRKLKKTIMLTFLIVAGALPGFYFILLNIKRSSAEREALVKASLKEKETLLQEIHHRVKNNMQVISSLLKLQSNSFDDDRIKKPLLESQNRVKAMASVHESLYKSKDLSSISILPFLKGLTSSILTSYQLSSENIVLKIDSDEILVNIEQATPIGLIINELVSNSIKYAFPAEGQGNIIIKINRMNSKSICLRFSDDGIGFPAAIDWRNSDNLGLKLVKNLAENQLDGSIKMETDNGTHFVIFFKENNH